MQEPRSGRSVVIGIAVVLVAIAAGIGILTVLLSDDSRGERSSAFCTAAREYDDRISKGTLSPARRLLLAERMAAYAPDPIRDQAGAFLDALARQAGGDRNAPQDVERPGRRVNRYAAQECGFYRQEPGSGA